MNIYRLYYTTGLYQPYRNHDRRIIAHSEDINLLMRRAESEFSAWRKALMQPKNDDSVWLMYRGRSEAVAVYINVPESLEWVELDGEPIVVLAQALTPANDNQQPGGYVVEAIPLLEAES